MLISPSSYYRKILENDMQIQSDVMKLKEWFRTAQLDPNDPSNVALFELLKVPLE